MTPQIIVRETLYPHAFDHKLAPRRWVITKGELTLARYLNPEGEWQRCPITYLDRDSALGSYNDWLLAKKNPTEEIVL